MINKIVYIIPAYNEEATLKEQMLRLIDHVYPADIKAIIIENGSNDNTYKIAKELETKYPITFTSLSEPDAGIGYAYHRGIEEALRIYEENDWVCLSAADLPFNFTDLENFLSIDRDHIKCAIGSKLHIDSKVSRSFSRSILTFLLSKIRKYALGMATKDCQGTIFIKLSVAKEFFQLIKSRDFFYTTELVYQLERKNVEILEMPIVYLGEIRKSSINSLKHGFNYLNLIFSLAKRNK